jgi:hypothetical protein
MLFVAAHIISNQRRHANGVRMLGYDHDRFVRELAEASGDT